MTTELKNFHLYGRVATYSHIALDMLATVYVNYETFSRVEDNDEKYGATNEELHSQKKTNFKTVSLLEFARFLKGFFGRQKLLSFYCHVLKTFFFVLLLNPFFSEKAISFMS